MPIGLAVLLLVVAQVVLAAPPSANFNISDTTLDTGQTVTFTSTSTDPDNDIATYEWDFDYDGNFAADATGTSASTSYSTPGARSVALRVTDGPGDPMAGGDGTADSSLSVKSVNVSVPNTPPNATDIGVVRQGTNNGDLPYVGQTVRMTGAASDPDGDPITYEWNFGDGGTATGQVADHAYSSRGAKTVTLTVRDNRGGTDTHQASITINDLPVANINILNTSAEPGQKNTQPLAGQAFAFTSGTTPAIAGTSPAPGCPAIAGSPAGDGSSDPGGSISTVQWDFDPAGAFQVDFTGASAPSPAQGYPAGMRSVAVRVIDNNNATTTVTRQFRINSAPAAGFVAEPLTPIVNQNVTFSSTSGDPDAADSGQLTHAWDLDNDGTFCEPGEQGANVARAFPTAGNHPIKLRVTDTGGTTREVNRNLMVQNTIPRGGFTWSPNSPLPGQAVTFSGAPSVATAGKSIQSYQWDFNFDPSSDQFDVDAEGGTVARTFPTAGTHSVALKVTETGGGYAIVFDRVVVNAPPQAAFTVAPGSPFTGDVVTYSSTSVDPDGPLARHEWDLDGDGAYDDASGPVVSASYRRARGYNVGLRITDSKGAVATAVRRVSVRKRPLKLLSGVLIELGGELRGRVTRVTNLLVRAPKKTVVRVRCQGKSCPKVKSVKRKGKGRKKLRVKHFERSLQAGTRIIITISRPGYFTKHTTYKMRRGKRPLRRDLCLVPGAKKPRACPATS